MIALERCRLYLLFTPDTCRIDPWQTLDACLRAGVDLVQWRVAEPDRDGASRCVEVCGEAALILDVGFGVLFRARCVVDEPQGFAAAVCRFVSVGRVNGVGVVRDELSGLARQSDLVGAVAGAAEVDDVLAEAGHAGPGVGPNSELDRKCVV